MYGSGWNFYSQIYSISLAVREYGVARGIKAFRFITAGLVAPPKEQVLACLGIAASPGQEPSNPPRELKRRGEIDVGSYSLARCLYFIADKSYLRDLSFCN